MAKKIVKAAAVQIKPIETSVKETILHGVALAKQAAEREADMICFPEHWLPERTIPSPMSPIPGLQSIAEEYGVGLVGGAFYEKVKDQTHLSSPVVGSDGNLLGRQFKMHLFRSERKYARPGDSYNIFRINGHRIGVLVCYDVDFPEPSRIYALRGAEIIFCPSRIVKPGITPWQQYLTVRCLENRIPIVAPNVYSPPWFTGHSSIISLTEDARTKISHPRITALARRGEGILTEDLDLRFHNRLRRERFADRRPETYN